jgi:hypothetical protein
MIKRLLLLSAATGLVISSSSAWPADPPNNISVQQFRLLAQMPPQMTEQGCCSIRNGTNGWDWTNTVTREQCLKDNRAVGGSVSDVYHYPNETCETVKQRCGNPNPC